MGELSLGNYDCAYGVDERINCKEEYILNAEDNAYNVINIVAEKNKYVDINGCKDYMCTYNVKTANNNFKLRWLSAYSAFEGVGARAEIVYIKFDNNDKYYKIISSNAISKFSIYNDLLIHVAGGISYDFNKYYSFYKINNQKIEKLLEFNVADSGESFKIENGKITYISTKVNFGTTYGNNFDAAHFTDWYDLDTLDDILEAEYEITYDDLMNGKSPIVTKVRLTKTQLKKILEQ